MSLEVQRSAQVVAGTEMATRGVAVIQEETKRFERRPLHLRQPIARLDRADCGDKAREDADRSHERGNQGVERVQRAGGGNTRLTARKTRKT